MSANGFTLLWAKTLDSSIWRRGTKEDRLLWMTILMMKNADGNVYASLPGLADRARVSEKECEQSLEKFLSKDPRDTSGVNGGRKLELIPGGWHVVNHDLYRFSTEAKRAFWADDKARQRARNKVHMKTTGSKREQLSVRDSEDGAVASPSGSGGALETSPVSSVQQADQSGSDG